jgi:hypothetical protein
MEPVTWTTLEFQPQERHRDWNWYAGLVAAIVAAVAIFYGDIFFGIFAVFAGIVVIIYAVIPPKHLTITISKEGIAVNQDRIPMAAIKQFWLDETDKQDKLLLLVQGSFAPLMSFPLEGIKADVVREALKPYAPEVEMRESRSIKLFEHLGF